MGFILTGWLKSEKSTEVFIHKSLLQSVCLEGA